MDGGEEWVGGELGRGEGAGGAGVEAGVMEVGAVTGPPRDRRSVPRRPEEEAATGGGRPSEPVLLLRWNHQVGITMMTINSNRGRGGEAACI